MKLVYLGTGGAMPTIDRGLSCTVLALEKSYIMVDCGDGACRQYVKSNLKWNKPMTLLITHMHSDHTMGILGLLQSMDLVGRTEPIIIYGVKGIKSFVESVNRSVNFKLGFTMEVREVVAGDSFSINDGVEIETIKTKHQVPSIAYLIKLPNKEGKLNIDLAVALGVPERSPFLGALKRGEDITLDNGNVIKSRDVVGSPRKGKRIGFSGDTRPLPELHNFFRNADFVTFETTFRSDEQELAIKAKHSTAEETGKLAQQAGIKTLICNHFSARHTDVSGFKTDVKEHFEGKVILSKDFLEVELD